MALSGKMKVVQMFDKAVKIVYDYINGYRTVPFALRLRSMQMAVPELSENIINTHSYIF